MKRIIKALSIILVVAMVVGMLPLSIFADEASVTHKVQFKLNYYGAHKIPSQNVADGEYATQPENVTRIGWIFDYWYVETEGGKRRVDLSEPITEDMILRAHWVKDKAYWASIWERQIFSVLNNKDDIEDEEGTSPDAPQTDNKLTYTEYLEKQQDELNLIKELNNGTLPDITIDEEDYIPSFIDGTYSDNIVTDFDSAISSLEDVKHLMGIGDAAKEFVGDQKNEFDGTNYYRLQQMYGEYVVYGKDLVVTTDEEGKVLSLSGDYDPIYDIIDTTININAEKACEIISAEGYAGNTEPQLVVYTLDGYNELAWLFDGDSYTAFVSAVDGIIINSLTKLITDTEATVGRGENSEGETVSINTVFDDAAQKYYLYDSVRNITYYDLNNADYTYTLSNGGRDAKISDYYAHPKLSDGDNIWSDSAAIDFVENVSGVYDYYLETIGLYSFDGKNGGIHAFFDDGMFGHIKNAFSAGPHVILGPITTILAFSRAGKYHERLDVVAHEFTHSIQNSYIRGIRYSGQTGSLMEGYSDIAGELAELYINGYTDWVHGERVINNPRSNGNYPDKYMGSGYYTGSGDSGGVHHNSTVISHVAYEIYNNGICDAQVLTELFFRAWNYLGKTADFSDYRAAVVAAAKIMGMSADEIAIIETAFTEANIKSSVSAEDYYTEFSEVKITVIDSSTREPIRDAKVTLINAGFLALGPNSKTTNRDGKVDFFQLPGIYILLISAEGYKDYYSICISLPFIVNELIIPIEAEGPERKYEVGGTVTDAMTGETVEGVTMNFRKGYNVTSGRVDLTLTTSADGAYHTDALEAGYYTVELVKEGYIRSYVVVRAVSTEWSEGEKQNISISPEITTDDTIRIVLSWGENPEDLDSHIYGTVPGSGYFHVYYMNTGAYDKMGDLIASLDIDDITSYGPETTTLHWKDAGEYTFSVHLYAGSGTISTSSANVKIYSGNALIYNINVPEGSEDMRWWKVFTFKDGEFTFYNTFSNSQE